METLPRVAVVNQIPRQQRGIRRPTHNWAVKNPPFTFQPCMIAPVLPGETMKSARWKARAITDPVKGRLIGWWLEHYLFYVPISAMLDDASSLKTMFIDATQSLATNATRHAPGYMKDDGTVNSYDWLHLCVNQIVERWFRSQSGEASDYYFSGAPPGDGKWFKVKAECPGWMDSLRATADDTSLDVTLVDEAGSGTLTASELDTAMRTWQLQRLQGLTMQSYEEFLLTYRVRVPIEPGRGEVELLRYSRAWQYPSNTVVPTTGAVTSAVSWSIEENAGKDRFFREPGFIVMGTCARPKVYHSKQTSYAASQMTDAFAWLPATLWENSRVGERSLSTDQLIKDIGASTFDVKDLLVYGDQFVNDLAATEFNLVALPTGADWNRQYPSDTDIKGLFVSDTVYMVTQDGHCELTIASSVNDPEPML